MSRTVRVEEGKLFKIKCRIPPTRLAVFLFFFSLSFLFFFFLSYLFFFFLCFSLSSHRLYSFVDCSFLIETVNINAYFLRLDWFFIKVIRVNKSCSYYNARLSYLSRLHLFAWWILSCTCQSTCWNLSILQRIAITIPFKVKMFTCQFQLVIFFLW